MRNRQNLRNVLNTWPKMKMDRGELFELSKKNS